MRERRSKLGNTEKALQELAEALGLETPPQRIECFDISNTQGENQVASMVVCERGLMNKKEYRKFKIKREDTKPNDFASMEEVVTRRLNESKTGNVKFNKLPALLIVDGGKGQVSSAVKAMEASGVKVPLVGLAKQFEHLYLPNEPDPVILPRNSQALYMLQRIRDEAHRFANTYQAQVRGKKATHSTLEDIPGIGAKRRKALQLYFGSLNKIKAATHAEIAVVPGMSPKLAETVYDFLHDATKV